MAATQRPAAKRAEMLHGTLDLLVLETLYDAPLHGWGINKLIRSRSDGAFEANQGSLYPALHRLEGLGLIEASWSNSPAGRRARYYRLTKDGHRQLKRRRAAWVRFAEAVERLLFRRV